MGFMIGNIKIENQVVLAPMAGVSNSAFRKLARKNGAGLVFAEMVSDKALVHRNEKTLRLLKMSDEERPMAQQIFGSDLKSMVEAARYIDQHSNCDIIDINMGCPVPKVAIRSQAGASLLKNPDLIYELVKAVVESVSKPVTVKIRSGWDKNSINATSVAKMIEKAGAKAITIHARTRAQGYSGCADWDIIRQVKESVSIPVIGNGDVIDGETAQRMLIETKCDAVMVGRASLGRPWVFKEINSYLKKTNDFIHPSPEEIKEILMNHATELIALKGEKLGILEMRGHGPWYFKGVENSKEMRKKLSKMNTLKDLIQIIDYK